MSDSRWKPRAIPWVCCAILVLILLSPVFVGVGGTSAALRYPTVKGEWGTMHSGWEEHRYKTVDGFKTVWEFYAKKLALPDNFQKMETKGGSLVNISPFVEKGATRNDDYRVRRATLFRKTWTQVVYVTITRGAADDGTEIVTLVSRR